MNKDKILDFIEDHRALVIIGIAVIILIITIVGIKSISDKRAAQREADEQARIAYGQQQAAAEQARLEAEANKKVEQPYNSYAASLGLNNGDGRVQVQPEEEEEVVEYVDPNEKVQLEARYPVDILKFDWVEVPEKMVDGSSCKGYLASVGTDSFHLGWGTPLTEDDFIGGERFLIGTEQNPNDTLYGDLQSVGWLHEHINLFQPNDAIKFCNLHVIGDIGTGHICLLCSYDWYSAFGLTDTLVVIEDPTGTFDKSLLSDGDIFSTTVFAHNLEATVVNGQRVIVAQWADYVDTKNGESAEIIDADSYKSAVDKALEERQMQNNANKETTETDSSADDVLKKTKRENMSTDEGTSDDKETPSENTTE